ncbi:hypothetical protein GUJ93_ZPchr0001g29571 [Zizania palustris]|uniref:Uncharacterized protein n=1 Tax=Zizania palustris TaxID=103762 RepID=A0A8J5RSH8_ZIZPA|nr:hypothetical protein GUJ93_ZPchr0001g29571 [Zizania palustris]
MMDMVLGWSRRYMQWSKVLDLPQSDLLMCRDGLGELHLLRQHNDQAHRGIILLLSISSFASLMAQARAAPLLPQPSSSPPREVGSRVTSDQFSSSLHFLATSDQFSSSLHFLVALDPPSHTKLHCDTKTGTHLLSSRSFKSSNLSTISCNLTTVYCTPSIFLSTIPLLTSTLLHRLLFSALIPTALLQPLPSFRATYPIFPLIPPSFYSI